MQQGNLTVGTFFAFLTYQAIVIWPVRHLGRVLTDTGKAMVALTRLREILEEPAEEDRPPAAEAPPERLRGAIEVENLTFAHRDGEPVLRGMSFRVEPGQTLALLGPPGSGKSTIVQLLLRLYDHEHGAIRLDGRDVRTLPRSFVRGQIGVVLQQPFLYSRTVEANVRVGRAEATREEVTESADAACIHAAIERFERGYDTLIGERGVTLSGGQRQRLAIARALLKDPAVLVLDDALSAVDTRTEARILDALRHRRHRRTTILIAHRLSSILHADRILVLEGGRIVQSGTHAELVAAPGPYRRLWRIQNDLEDEIAADLAPAGMEDGE
jgi:ATP-binding cassette subfamily B protein